MDSELTLAFGLHQAGRFADAARRYHALLAREPDHADACTSSASCTTSAATPTGPSS